MLKNLLSRLVLAAMIAFPCAYSGYAAEMGFAPQTSNERGIKVTVAPQAVAAATWDFEVTLESHTQSLNDDLARSSVLVADGKQYPPVGWDGAAPGGHHRKGLLRFKAIVPKPGAVELQIRLAGDSSPRSFAWQSK
ncbi:MAG: hypothetical protein Q8O64_09200 [Sideroxyarcus sp.]|nr:hypothetical protein [Sideroxyarcus sp.]